MGAVRLAGAAAALAMGAGLATAGQAAAADTADAVNYVALGDSYSAGVGTGEKLPGDTGCGRSPAAYPELWRAANDPSAYSFQACSGAKTGDVIANQVPALSDATTLVSVTVGGNDAGFTRTVEGCLTGGDSGCKQATDEAIDYVNTTLGGQLDDTYAQIESAAPSAELVVLGYPHLYQLDGSCRIGLSDTSRGYLNHAADVLDDKIADRAQAAGATFEDLRDDFAGHEICSDDWWLNSTTFPVENSYHPNKEGQSDGYLPAFSTAVDSAAEPALD